MGRPALYYLLIPVIVVVWFLTGAVLSLQCVSGPYRLAEFVGVFPLGVVVDCWSVAFIALLCAISSSVFV